MKKNLSMDGICSFFPAGKKKNNFQTSVGQLIFIIGKVIFYFCPSSHLAFCSFTYIEVA